MLALLKQPPVGAIEKEGFLVSSLAPDPPHSRRVGSMLFYFFFFFIFSLSSGRLGGNSKTRIYPVYLVYLNNKPWERIVIIKKGMGLCSAMRMLLLLSWPISSLSRCLHFTCERFLKKKKKKIPAWGMFGTYQICHYDCLSDSSLRY